MRYEATRPRHGTMIPPPGVFEQEPTTQPRRTLQPQCVTLQKRPLIDATPHETPAPTFEKDLATRHLTQALARFVEDTGHRALLVASAHPGEGKSTFVRIVAAQWENASRRRLTCLSLKSLAMDSIVSGYAKPILGHEDVLLVDGPAMLETTDSLALKPTWQEFLHASVIIAMGQVTPLASLKAAAQRLKALGVPPVAVIWNERDFSADESVGQR